MVDGDFPELEMERRASLQQFVPDPAALKDVSGPLVSLSEPQCRPRVQVKQKLFDQFIHLPELLLCFTLANREHL